MKQIRKIKKFFLFHKKDIHNSLFLYIMNFSNIILPIITIPYVTRILSTEGFGMFSRIFNFINYAQVLVEYGFILSGTRKIAIIEKKNEINQVFTNIMCCRFILTIIAIFFNITVGLYQFTSIIEWKCLFALLLIIIGTGCQQTWLLQGLQKMKEVALLSIGSRIVTTILMFTLVREREDVPIYCMLYALTFFLTGVFGLLIAFKELQVKFIKTKWEYIFCELKDGSYTFLSSISGKILTSFGITILGFNGNDSLVGIYSAIYKIPYILSILFSPISQVMYPNVSKAFKISLKEGVNKIFKVMKWTMPIYIIGVFTIGASAPQIILILFGREYLNYVKIIYPLLGWLILGLINNFLGIQFLTASGHAKEYGKSFLVSMLIAVLINLYFGKKFNIYGISYATLLSELFLSILLLLNILKIYRMQKQRLLEQKYNK